MAQKAAIFQATELLGQVAQCEVDKLPGELGYFSRTADETALAVITKIQELLDALGTVEYSRGPSQKHQYAKEIRNESFSSSSLTGRGASPSIGLSGPTWPTDLGPDVPTTISNQRAHGDLDGLSHSHLTDLDFKTICTRLNYLESRIGNRPTTSLSILERLDALEAQTSSVKTPSPNAISSIASMDDFLSDSQFEPDLGPFLRENDHFTMTGGVDQEFGSFVGNTRNISRGQGNDNQSLGGQDNEGIARSSTMATPSWLGYTEGGRFNCSHAGCRKTFTRKGDYNRHLRLHGTPQFPCQVPGCERVGPRGFTRSDKLLAHIQNKH